MIIIWSGWGLLVIPLALLGLLAGVPVVTPLANLMDVSEQIKMSAIGVVGSLLGAAAIYFFAKWREKRTAEFVTDETTQETVEIRHSAGSLFFITMRGWALLLALLSPVIIVAQYFR